MVPEFIARLANWLLALLKNLFDSVVLLLKDLLAWGLDIIFNLIDEAMTGLDAVLPENPFQGWWSSLPPEVTGMANALGLPEALTLIVGALVVRFLLQLIPFVRWGS